MVTAPVMNRGKFVKLRYIALVGGLLAGGIFGGAPVTVLTAQAATPEKKPTISEEASAALMRMGQTLRDEQFSFQARTIRVYSDANGYPLHIFHTLKVTVHRPSRLLAEVTGDDGTTKLVFDGKTLIVYSATAKKYASIPVPEGTIAGMLKEAVGRLGIDFPLADFLTDAPDKAFLTGVTEGTVVNTVTIDGVPCLHMFFLAAARHRARALGGEERSVAAAPAHRDLPIAAGAAELHRGVLRLEFQYPPVRR